MTKTPTILTLLPLLLALLTACGDPKPVTDALHRAEMLMNEHPDSALAVLNILSPDAMGKERTRAHYALLYTQAQDKNYIDETNDSLITLAADYYRHTDDVRRKFLSHYYKGRVLSNAGNYLDATSCYMEAEQLADVVGDDYLVGLLYAEMGRIYRLYYDYPKSLEAYQKAAECYERAGKMRHRNYMWLNQSSVFRNMNNYKECERLHRMSLEAAKRENDYTLVKNCLGDLVLMCIEQERMPEARKLYEELRPLVDDGFMSAPFCGGLAKMYATEQNHTLAKECLEKGWKRAKSKTDSVSLYLATSKVYDLQGNSMAAYQKLLKGVELQKQGTYQALQQPVLTVQRDFLSERLEFEAYKLRMGKLLNLLSTLFFLLLLGVLVYVFLRIFRKYKKKSQRVICLLKDEKNEVKKEKNKIALVLEQLEKDKKKADQAVAMLSEEIDKNKEENNVIIAGLNEELQIKKQSIEELKQTLEQGREKSEAEKSVLLGKLEQEHMVAHQMIQTLNDAIAQKDDSRRKMKKMIQQLDDNRKLNEESIACLRTELENQEKEYRLYVQKVEDTVEALQDENRKMMYQKVELLKKLLEQVVAVVLFYERKCTKEETRIKRVKEGIHSLKTDYYAGDDEYQKVEALVNRYLDNVMVHFRKEVVLANESEYRRVCYMFAGVSGQVIGEIMKESKDAVYQRRSRLLKKINSLACVHKEMFIVLISK